MSIDLEAKEQPESTQKNRKSKVIVGEYIQGLQIKHFLWYNLLPFLGCIVAIASLWWFPFKPTYIALLVGMWAVSMVGMSVGLHRYFAHRAFKTNQTIRNILAILGCMSAQGPLISWVAVHRRHHEFSDKIGDPHSPNPDHHGGGFIGTVRGLWHAHVGWLTNHDYPSPVYYAPELLRDQTITRINRYYAFWIILGLLIPTFIGGIIERSWIGAFEGFLWGGPMRVFVVDNSVLSINSFSHIFGGQSFDAGDNSRNNPWIAIPTFGESWQNNHHAFESSAALGLKWWQIDLGYGLIWGLQKLGLVWDVNLPLAKAMEAKKRLLEISEP